MGTSFETLQQQLRAAPKRWLITGAAGFIGSNLVEKLLQLGQQVVGLDNFATGHRRNIEAVSSGAGSERFEFIEGDIRDRAIVERAMQGVQVVLHQAALGSVPRSIKDPWSSHTANVDGFLSVLIAARDAQVERFVYASSSSVYGDAPELPKQEAHTGRPLSPYAATKAINEVYATAFALSYQLPVVGLRYFNVFGPRQDPEGAYAAVIPRWIGTLLQGEQCTIYGDGETSRDFCFIDNVVQANLLAALCPRQATNAVYNVACGERTTLLELYDAIVAALRELAPHLTIQPVVRSAERPGDIRHSLADLSRVEAALGYAPQVKVREGILRTVRWYLEHQPQLAATRSTESVPS